MAPSRLEAFWQTPVKKIPASVTTVTDRIVGQIASILSWVLIAAGLATIVILLIIVIRSYSPVPTVDHSAFLYQLAQRKADMWDFNVSKPRANMWAILWAQHNGHRIVFPKLFYVTDLLIFGGRIIFLRVVNFLLEIVQLCVFGYLLTRLGNISKVVVRSILGVAAFCLFCPVQADIFTSGWEVAYLIPFVSATIAFAAIALMGHRGSPSASRLAVLAWVVGIIGSYSLANGFLIWPVLLVEIVALRLSKRMFWLTATVGGLVIGFNFIAYHTAVDPAVVRSALSHPGRTGAFFLQIIVYAWQGISYSAGLSFALAGVLIVLIFVVKDTVLGQPNNRLRVFLLCTGVYEIATLLLTSISRWNLGLAPRYEAGALIFWCVCVICLYLFLNCRWGSRGLVMAQLASCLVLGASAKQIRPVMLHAQQRKQVLQVAGAALATRVYDKPAIIELGYRLWPLGYRSLLERRHASLFASGPALFLGTTLKQHYVIDSVCSGAIEAIRPVADPDWPGFEVSGWAWNNRAEGVIRDLLFTDSKSIIIGIGSSDHLLNSHKAEVVGAHLNATWKGFLPLSARGGAVYSYGITSSHHVCSLGVIESLDLSKEEARSAVPVH